MPQILLVKTSSLGDVVQNLPVVSDILLRVPGAEIDWVVEESLQAIPRLHRGVRSAIPAATRRWRSTFWQARARDEMREFKSRLQSIVYDLVLDTQGLIKSALIAWLARGRRCGLDFASAREPLAMFYDQTFSVSWDPHAVERNRSLAAQALGYDLTGEPDYGISVEPSRDEWLPRAPYVVLLHATADPRKLWSEELWVKLAAHLEDKGMATVLPWGSLDERERSERIARQAAGACVAPRLALDDAARVLAGASAAIGVDTGLAHLAAALGVPVIGIYLATDPNATGLRAGTHAVNLGNIGRAPVFDEVVNAFERLRAR